LGRVFGPVAGGLIFDLIGPQAPYAVGACIFFAALCFAIVQFRRDARLNPRPVPVSAD
jgi:predicted MFS family arabinose efflux permease